MMISSSEMKWNEIWLLELLVSNLKWGSTFLFFFIVFDDMTQKL